MESRGARRIGGGGSPTLFSITTGDGARGFTAECGASGLRGIARCPALRETHHRGETEVLTNPVAMVGLGETREEVARRFSTSRGGMWMS